MNELGKQTYRLRTLSPSQTAGGVASRGAKPDELNCGRKKNPCFKNTAPLTSPASRDNTLCRRGDRGLWS
jgi:hypothetical protein